MIPLEVSMLNIDNNILKNIRSKYLSNAFSNKKKKKDKRTFYFLAVVAEKYHARRLTLLNDLI